MCVLLLGHYVSSDGMVCENFHEGRFSAADRDIDACIKHQKENFRPFAVILEGECHGSNTCNNPSTRSKAAIYEIKDTKGM